MEQHLSTLTLSYALDRSSDEPSQLRILVLGTVHREKRRTLRRLAQTFSIKAFALDDETPLERLSRPESSWIVHGRYIDHSNSTHSILLDQATHVIWLQSSPLTTLRRSLIRTASKAPSSLLSISFPSYRSRSSLLLAGSDSDSDRLSRLSSASSPSSAPPTPEAANALTRSAFLSEPNPGKWHCFSGWKYRFEIRDWLREFEFEQFGHTSSRNRTDGHADAAGRRMDPGQGTPWWGSVYVYEASLAVPTTLMIF